MAAWAFAANVACLAEDADEELDGEEGHDEDVDDLLGADVPPEAVLAVFLHEALEVDCGGDVDHDHEDRDDVERDGFHQAREPPPPVLEGGL